MSRASEPRHSASVCGSSGGNGRDQGADAGGDGDRHVEQVVERQRGRCEDRGTAPEVLLCHRVGAAAVGIGVDGLVIREVDDEQQPDDDRHERHELGEGQGPERQEHGKESFRSVRSGAERIEPEDRHARPRADAFGLGFLRREGASEQYIEEFHD